MEDEQEAWLSGEVVNVEKKKVTVRIKGKEVRSCWVLRGLCATHRVILWRYHDASLCDTQIQTRASSHYPSQAVYKASSLHPVDLDVPDGGVDDMTKLAYLHEPGVLSNLRTRYSLDAIYVRDRSAAAAVARRAWLAGTGQLSWRVLNRETSPAGEQPGATCSQLNCCRGVRIRVCRRHGGLPRGRKPMLDTAGQLCMRVFETVRLQDRLSIVLFFHLPLRPTREASSLR